MPSPRQCQHKSGMAVPSEDDPRQMAMLCLQCHTVVDTFGPEALGEIGESLGDPEGDEWDEKAEEWGPGPWGPR